MEAFGRHLRCPTAGAQIGQRPLRPMPPSDYPAHAAAPACRRSCGVLSRLYAEETSASGADLDEACRIPLRVTRA